MSKPYKSEVEKNIKDVKAVCEALQLSPADAKIVASAYATARKFKDPIATLSTLSAYLTRAQMNEFEAQWDQVGRIVELIDTLPEKAPKAAPAATGDLSAFTPVKHAEFTFTPTAAFRRKAASPHPDVGLFLDKGEHLVLEGATRSTKSDRTVLKIKEGSVSLITAEWKELSQVQIAKLTSARSSKSTVYDRDRIIDEYLN